MVVTATSCNVARPPSDAAKPTWYLRLYVAGRTPQSGVAIDNLSAICREYLLGRCRLEIIDILKHPGQAAANQIVAVPTLVKRSPGPERRVIGDLSKTASVLAGLEIRSHDLDKGKHH